MKKRFKHITAYFFLIVFIAVKLSNLHVFLHVKDGEHAKVEHCDVCKFVLSQDVTPAMAAETFNFNFTPQVVYIANEVVINYSSIVYNQFTALTLYNKPPPVC